MNHVRLEKSLRLLRDVNDARLLGLHEEARKREAMLQQHDYDARDKVDARQLTIYERAK
jgi:hypothetical protein